MKAMQYTYNFEPEMYKYILQTNILNRKRDEDKIFKALVEGYGAKEYKINITTLSDRLKAGLSIHEALNKPIIKSGGFLLFTLNGETKLLSEWCKIYNTNYQTAWKKIKKGQNIKQVLKLE